VKLDRVTLKRPIGVLANRYGPDEVYEVMAKVLIGNYYPTGFRGDAPQPTALVYEVLDKDGRRHPVGTPGISLWEIKVAWTAGTPSTADDAKTAAEFLAKTSPVHIIIPMHNIDGVAEE
jgi:hypothetical protein